MVEIALGTALAAIGAGVAIGFAGLGSGIGQGMSADTRWNTLLANKYNWTVISCVENNKIKSIEKLEELLIPGSAHFYKGYSNHKPGSTFIPPT